jgi:hypothetical protein
LIGANQRQQLGINQTLAIVVTSSHPSALPEALSLKIEQSSVEVLAVGGIQTDVAS